MGGFVRRGFTVFSKSALNVSGYFSLVSICKFWDSKIETQLKGRTSVFCGRPRLLCLTQGGK